MRMQRKTLLLLLLGLILLFSFACSLPKLETTVGSTATVPPLSDVLGEQSEPQNATPPTGPASPGEAPVVISYPQPTPDSYRQLPALRTQSVQYTVQVNDSLAAIARAYSIGLEALIQANEIDDPGMIHPGEVLTIPPPEPKPSGTGFKILPDSEVVYGPSTVGFDVGAFIQAQGGYLSQYQEQVEGETRSGSDIVLRVSQDYSINPRLLLALLDYTAGWLSTANPSTAGSDYPLGYVNAAYQGLYRQLAWAANETNRGYYLWRVNGIAGWVLTDGSVVPPEATINAGTAGIQHVLSLLLDYPAWLEATNQDGLYTTYFKLFGSPFPGNPEPILPAALTQPALQLPFEPGQTWRFTGGPHGAFGGGAAWAALDFAPPGNASGCVQSDAWVVAMTDGFITRSGRGQVIQDLDGDGNEQTGWVLLYLHIETRDRIEAGIQVQAGDRIGHPSCEGGVSTGTHVHVARRYNGEWIPADRELPFNLEGWLSSGTGIAYNGYLTRNGETVTALTGTNPQNQITHE